MQLLKRRGLGAQQEEGTNTQVEPTYGGYDSEVSENVHQLAGRLPQPDRESIYSQVEDDRPISIASTVAPGVSPMNNPGMDPRLDPNSDMFDGRFWIKNFKSFMDKDTDYYKSYSLGVGYKNLRAYGDAVDSDYQSTVSNSTLRLLNSLKDLIFTNDKTSKKFDILKPMDALINPGEVVVVLGRPGSGCTTLLKTIAANTHGFKIGKETEISYSGLSPKDLKKRYRGEVVYNAETDIHFPHLTVWQTLSLVAKFRTPQNRIPGVSREDYANSLTEVYMAIYGLLHTKNTKVGNELVRGVSGGERKRVSIAEVSLSGSRLQCWDNATRGLDAATALEFIRALRTQADVFETTALIAIYQCSQDAYDLFDKVSVLYEGHQIFFGRTDEAKGYFLKMGYECPARQTTADFLTSITSPRERIARAGYEDKVPKTAKEFEEYWKESPEYQKLIKDIDESFQRNKTENVSKYIKTAHNAKQSKNMRSSSPYTVSFWMQTRYCLKREFYRMRNDYSPNLFDTLSNSLLALVLSSLFYNLQPNTHSLRFRSSSLFFALFFNGFQSFLEILSLYESRPILEKHKQYALYHPAAASLSSIIALTPQKIIISIVFNLIYYFMIHYRRTAGHFFFYLLINIISTFTMSHVFRVIGSAVSSLDIAMVPANLALLAITMFTGFTLPVTYMLGWSRWINYINPLGYAFEALMVNEFAGVEFACSTYIPAGPNDLPAGAGPESFVCYAPSASPGDTVVSGTDYLITAFGYRPEHKWRNFGILLAFAIGLGVIYLLLTEYNESAKQKGEILLFQRSSLKKIKKLSKSAKQNDIESLANEKDVTKQEESVGGQNVESLEAGTDIFHWRDVHYTVQIKNEKREILTGVDGWVKPGTLTALMGASGAGKTTLLDVLANRVTTGVVTGNMFVNGHLRDISFQRSTGYVQQQDLHLATATVREALRFSAYLRQPFEVSKKEKEDYVEEVIKILDMQTYADAIVGVAGEGLNVEQRKRLTIGVELAAKPKLLLFLDEPTSGLDSQTAWSICQLMRKLANHGQAILCTIHQPSAILMKEFDRLLFLARGGKTIYFGDLGDNCQTLIDYFERNGAPKCPPDANPAEWMLSVIGAAPGSHANQDYYEVWLRSQERQEVLKELQDMETELIKIPMEQVNHSSYAAPIWYQLYIVSIRVFQQYWRSPITIWSKLFLSVFSSLFIGFAVFKASPSIQGLQNQLYAYFMFTLILNPIIDQILPDYGKQRDLYETRERPSKTFSWFAFMASQIIVEIPWNIFMGTLAFFTFYYPAGFYHNAEMSDSVSARGAFAWFGTVVFFVFIGSTANLVSAPFQLAHVAGSISSLMFTLGLAFCGVVVQRKDLPGFWNFMYYMSPYTYFVDSLLPNALADTKLICDPQEFVRVVPLKGMNCGEYLGDYIKAAGTGYLVDANSTSMCELCPLSTTNAFLETVGQHTHLKWRNLGICMGFIAFNMCGALFFYWLFRVPKKGSRVQKVVAEKPPVSGEEESGSSKSTK